MRRHHSSIVTSEHVCRASSEVLPPLDLANAVTETVVVLCDAGHALQTISFLVRVSFAIVPGHGLVLLTAESTRAATSVRTHAGIVKTL